MQFGRIGIWDDQVPLEHLRSLRGTMEKFWQYIYSGGWQIILQWQGGQTRTGRWISCSQRHREHCHELPSTLKQPYHYPPEGKTIYITIIQAYAPTSDYDGDAVEDFYERLQEILDHSLKNGTLVVLGDWNAKVGEDALKNWKGTCGRYCNQRTIERGFCWGIHSANTKHPKDAPQGLSSISKSLKTLKFQSPSKQWLVEWLIGEALTLLDADDTN